MSGRVWTRCLIGLILGSLVTGHSIFFRMGFCWFLLMMRVEPYVLNLCNMRMSITNAALLFELFFSPFSFLACFTSLTDAKIM
jgi:hypothetical protein